MSIIVWVISLLAQFPYADWAELLESCYSMSKHKSPQEKSVKKHEGVLLGNCEIKNAE